MNEIDTVVANTKAEKQIIEEIKNQINTINKIKDIHNNENNIFTELDRALIDLAKCDSSIEYAPHIRESFNKVIEELNKLKNKMNYNKLAKDSNEYFKED